MRIFEAELKACQATLSGVAWETEAAANTLGGVSCPSCRSSLIRQRDPENTKQFELSLYCSACGKNHEVGSVLSLAFEETFGAKTQTGSAKMLSS